MKKYVIGLDYGTLSGRAALVDASDGRVLATAEHPYAHGVMDTALPDGTPLPPDWALQHPQDYLDVLDATLPTLLAQTGVNAAQVAGVALDVTSATVMPVTAEGMPLCFLPEYAARPHAWLKLWKHHAAQQEAQLMTDMAIARQEPWLSAYGGKVSSEWLLPKLWQVLREDEELYRAMDAWVEMTDWLTWQLCGVRWQNACSAGYKCFHDKQRGFPPADYFAALDERLRYVVQEKLSAPVRPAGSFAGRLTAEMAARLGLLEGTAIALGGVDAHASVLATGITRPGQMLAIIGTSTCHMTLANEAQPVPGVCGMVEDGILPGLWGCEAGQSCVGDLLAWFVENCAPAACRAEANRAGMNLHAYLTAQAQRLAPGESGLLALDWWNGNRSVLTDAELSGLLIGMTLRTTPAEIYRALMEATAYGTRVIVDNYRDHGMPITEFYALGGISQKNPLMMQIYADVLNMPVRVVDAPQSGAQGSAVMAAFAAGLYPSLEAASAAMAAPVRWVYEPDSAHAAVYERLYREYLRLHDLFGRGGCDAMKQLRQLRREARPHLSE